TRECRGLPAGRLTGKQRRDGSTVALRSAASTGQQLDTEGRESYAEAIIAGALGLAREEILHPGTEKGGRKAVAAEGDGGRGDRQIREQQAARFRRGAQDGEHILLIGGEHRLIARHELGT